ncbi:hypothetical protein KJZ63_02895 [Patescibacteria group bacterium]|nr:hypothetical protein [Patescibacteria group bacterium]
MRRRERFVVASIILSLGLFIVQLVDLEYRVWAVVALGFVSYLLSAWALFEDLQPFEWFTVLPFPVFYAISVGFFYFLLPTNFLSRLLVLTIFGVGMYALFLTSNIFSVAKGKAIQLIHAAHAIGLLFTLFTSLLLTNTVFSLHLPFYLNGLAVAAIHFPLVLMSLWSVKLEQKVSRETLVLSGMLTLILTELVVGLSFYPISVWNQALLTMAVLYIGLGVLQNYLRGILFSNAIREYSLVAGLVGFIFLMLFPLK